MEKDDGMGLNEEKSREYPLYSSHRHIMSLCKERCRKAIPYRARPFPLYENEMAMAIPGQKKSFKAQPFCTFSRRVALRPSKAGDVFSLSFGGRWSNAWHETLPCKTGDKGTTGKKTGITAA
jgi:hypothetical protein